MKELETKKSKEERAVKLQLEQEAKETAKKYAIEKKRLDAERSEQVATERRRRDAEERQKRELDEFKQRTEKIDLAGPISAIATKKSVTDELRDAMLYDLKRKDVIDLIGKNVFPRLSQLLGQASEFAFKKALINEGYSVSSKTSPSRILFDIGHGAGLESLSETNGERRFLRGLASFLFSPPQDCKYRIQFEDNGVSVVRVAPCLDCREIAHMPPQTLEELCINLKKYLVANRIAWRDLNVCDVIAEINKEPGRTERLKETLRGVKTRLRPRARALNHVACLDTTMSKLINDVSNQQWRPLCDYDHLSGRKKVLSEFPPSLFECKCDTCQGVPFIAYNVAFVAPDYKVGSKSWINVFHYVEDFSVKGVINALNLFRRNYPNMAKIGQELDSEPKDWLKKKTSK